MSKGNKQWKRSIVNALIAKGFSYNAAKKTANETIQKSVAKKEKEKPPKFTIKTEIIDGREIDIKVYPMKMR
jgi:hypothetical protein